MTGALGDLPEATVDEDVERAPGGADATPLESDVGITVGGEPPVVPDEPLSAQQEPAEVPDAIQEPEPDEPAEQATDNTDDEAPSG